MFQRFVNFIIIFLAVIFQASFFYGFPPYWPVPDLVLLLLLAWVMRHGVKKVFPWIITAGIVSDIVFSMPIGGSVVVLLFTAIAFEALAKKYLVIDRAWRLGTAMLLVVIASIISVILHWIIYSFGLHFRDVDFSPNELIAPRTLYQIATSPLLFLLLYWPVKKLEKITTFYSQGVK